MLNSEQNINKMQDFEGQKINFSGFELTKLIIRSKQLNNFLKSIDTKIQTVNIKAVLTCLASYYNEERNWFFVTQKNIAEETTLSRKTVNEIVQVLNDYSLIVPETMQKDSRRKVYCFTKKFFDVLLDDSRKILPSKYVTRLHIKNRDVSPGVTHPLYIINNENLINNENKFFEKISNDNFKPSDRIKTEFQEEFRDVIEQLTPSEWEKYKKLEGFEKREYLESKRKDFKSKISAAQTIKQINTEKQTAISPLDFDREQALKWVQNLPQIAQKSIFAKQLKERWKFTPEEIEPENSE